MIRFEEVGVCERGQDILKNINLMISEFRVGIVGANGSGKSTLVKLIKGLTAPTKGNVYVKGINTRKVSKKWLAKIGYIFQDPDHQIIFPIVEDDIAFGLKNLNIDKIQIRAKVEEILKKYELEKLRKNHTYTLSGGQKQLLAIAAILAMEPEFIIFDEPTTLLDLRNKNKICCLIQALPQAVLMVTHDLNLLKNFDRVIVLDEGEIVMDDKPVPALDFYVKSMS